jgi:hypothetical protein
MDDISWENVASISKAGGTAWDDDDAAAGGGTMEAEEHHLEPHAATGH